MKSFSGLLLILLASCGASQGNPPPPAEVSELFGQAELVDVSGFSDHMMEPFLSRDGAILFFNNRNEPPEQTDIHWAKRTGPASFQYQGKVAGADFAGKLDGVATMSSAGHFIFTSLRSYDDDKRSLWQGQFAAGRLADVRRIEGNVNIDKLLHLNMDSELSADGQTLYTTDNRFDFIRQRIAESDIVISRKIGDIFVRDPKSQELFAAINSNKLEYAVAISIDELTLFFTRLDLDALADNGEKGFSTYISTRADKNSAWQPPKRISEISGYAEAVTISPEGCSLYFHKMLQEKFRIFKITRKSC